MQSTSAVNDSELSRLKLFWALSRMTHGFLDMATPALAALLFLGAVPPPFIILLGAITTFAGYVTVYALNDIVDYRVDKEKIQTAGLGGAEGDLDAVYVRHPMAQGLLSYKEGIAWAGMWAAIAFVGAYVLNPACAVIFIIGSLLEVIYCLLLKISCLRTFVSGAVKTSGALAAVYAVSPHPSPLFLVLLFAWLFAWEIGGQNVPNDWTDMAEDKKIRAQTIPIRFGGEKSLRIILVSLAVTVLLSLCLFWVTPASLAGVYLVGAAGSGFFLLLLPAYRLYTLQTAQAAAALFNRSSYYPLTMLMVVLISVIA